MLVHRRDKHKFTRYKDVQIDDILKLEHDERLESIERVLAENPCTKEFKVLFKDNTVDWITIAQATHPAVLEFQSRQQENINVYDIQSAQWMKPVWEILEVKP